MGDLSHVNQKLNNCTIRRCWEECTERSNFFEELNQIKAFNKEKKYRKRGMALIPVKFGIAFGLKMLNQGGALVHIYKDGSVYISHGGVEMGQGLHTKVVQIASKILGIPCNKIHISETATDQVLICIFRPFRLQLVIP